MLLNLVAIDLCRDEANTLFNDLHMLDSIHRALFSLIFISTS